MRLVHGKINCVIAHHHPTFAMRGKDVLKKLRSSSLSGGFTSLIRRFILYNPLEEARCLWDFVFKEIFYDNLQTKLSVQGRNCGESVMVYGPINHTVCPISHGSCQHTAKVNAN
jgi:hypothetical protein